MSRFHSFRLVSLVDKNQMSVKGREAEAGDGDKTNSVDEEDFFLIFSCTGALDQTLNHVLNLIFLCLSCGCGV